MNLLEGIVHAVRQPPSPPHVGEVFYVWRQFVATTQGRILCKTLLNHTADPELREFIQAFLALEQEQINELGRLMKKEGIAFPPTLVDKPQQHDQLIPVGAHISDAEAISLMTGKIEGLMIFAFFGLSQSLRDDIGMLFYGILGGLAKQGFLLKQVSDKRGWLLRPPTYSPMVAQ